VVLARAVVAHGEGAHGGQRPVVGERLDDRVARSAVRAVDEGVAEPAIGGVAHLAQAVVADRQVGRDRRGAVRGGALALDDDEAERRLGRRRPLELLDPRHPRRRWRLGGETRGERVERGRVAARLDRHPQHVVADPARRGRARAPAGTRRVGSPRPAPSRSRAAAAARDRRAERLRPSATRARRGRASPPGARGGSRATAPSPRRCGPRARTAGPPAPPAARSRARVRGRTRPPRRCRSC
jgi:hypothetical protein